MFVQSNPGAAIASWNLNTHMMITAASSLQIIIIATLILVGAAHLPPVRHEKPAGHDRAAARRGSRRRDPEGGCRGPIGLRASCQPRCFADLHGAVMFDIPGPAC